MDGLAHILLRLVEVQLYVFVNHGLVRFLGNSVEILGDTNEILGDTNAILGGY